MCSRGGRHAVLASILIASCSVDHALEWVHATRLSSMLNKMLSWKRCFERAMTAIPAIFHRTSKTSHMDA